MTSSCPKATFPFMFPISIRDKRSSRCSPLGCLHPTHLIHHYILSALPSTYVLNATLQPHPAPSYHSLPPGPTGLLSGLRASTVPVRIYSPYSSHADHFKTLPPATSSPTLSLAHSIPAILTSLLSINYAKLPLLGMFFLRIRTACSLTAQPLCSAVTPERSLNIYLI